jgi:hypothetical protein
MVKSTKRDLELKVARLESQLKAVRHELGNLNPTDLVEYIPCGKIEEVFGHPFEDQIRDAVCNQFDGSTGWIRIDFSNYDFPFEHLLCNVSYSDADGTFVSKFCRLAKLTRDYDYDLNCWTEWK